MAQDQVESLLQAIKLTQKLRLGVTKVFQDLADGFQDSDGNDKQKEILSELQKKLSTVNTDFNELEKLAGTLVPTSYTASCGTLWLDPILDKTPIYSHLNHSYKWMNKMHEHAFMMHSWLHSHQLKRTPYPPITSGSKKLRHSNAMAYSFSMNKVDQLMSQVDRQYPDMHLTLTRPVGSCAVIQVTLGRTLKALILLRGLVIEWVRIKAFQEDFRTEDDKVDIWSQSRYQVFQKITDHANAATLHFYAPAMPELAVRSFTLWLQGYANLFSAPCHKCGKHLHNMMPPTWRDLRTREPYHEACRP